MNVKRSMEISVLLALSVILNIIESFFPFFNGSIPGMKLGLANSIVLLIIYIYGFKEAICMSILRVFLVGILRTGLFNFAFFFSLTGALLSTTMMYLAKKYTKLSIIGVSIIGSIFHTTGQVLIAVILLDNFNLAYYLPILYLVAIPTGIIVGLISKELVNVLQKRIEN